MTNTKRLDFQQQQYAFTAHIRNPEQVAVPAGIEARRMKIYRELLFNNVKGFIDKGFPVLKRLHNEAHWECLVRHFFANYQADSPYFVDIPRGFVDYLQQAYQPQHDDYPFLTELAHYEWVELALMTSTETLDMRGIDRYSSLLESRPILSPLAHSLGYHWSVHQISPEQIPTEPNPQPIFILVYRNLDDQVQFIELNAATALLFEALQDNEQLTGQQLLEKMAQDMQHPDPDLVLQGGLQTLTRWHHLGIVLGSRCV